MSATLNMYPHDQAAEMVGIQIHDVSVGHAKASLVIQANHINGLGIAHGGIVFLLADTAFAHACNSRGTQTVASHCSITFHLPSRCGDTLTAIAEEKYLLGRSGIYDITVTNQEHKLVAHFRGNSTALKPS